MAELSENTITVINQNDPNLPGFMDFKTLRNEGITHIGNLAGKIWTDHNVHDPGITILEVLVYALMDLGYKTNLPFEDLIALQNGDTEDNFLTPLQALTINPVNITDYRKLLLEIEGVRNTWLEPVEQKVDLYVDQLNNRLRCDEPDPIEPNVEVVYYPELGPVEIESYDDCTILDKNYIKLHLNGLYKVYIEKDGDIIKNKDQEDALWQEIKELLFAHRNLCEDFIEIEFLKPKDFGVCVNVEMLSGYDQNKVYLDIIKSIKNFIQPEIKYYTLNELLDKGKAIDDIFAGRPYRQQSYGFVDTEELENLERREEFHLSDLYKLILSIEGVRKINNIRIDGGQTINEPSYTWIEGNRIADDCVPVFSLEKTCVDLYSTSGLIKLDKVRLHKTLSFFKKFQLPFSNLDCTVPSGFHREDLEEYYSIQNDFPVVYGIGDDGLSESATLLRKTQALQLKGYLLFYDQMLANYTSQLANIRSLYSLGPETEKVEAEKQTYFTQIPDSVPGLDKLLKFYGDSHTIPQGTSLAVPVANNDQWKAALKKLQDNPRTELTISNYCKDNSSLVDMFTFSSSAVRSIYINQLIDSFLNEDYGIDIFKDRFGYFFVLCPNLPDGILLVGSKRYSTAIEAENEAKNTAFMASLKKSYNLVTDKSETLISDLHYFGISYHPISYIDLIQELTENKDEYLSRRKQFLDHLLARFGEEFTDYSLLQYQNEIGEPDTDRKVIEDQSNYVNEFAEISRNRGKAFNCLEPSWNTSNVSGFEKRVSLLSGLNNYTRRNLCNFEVTPCHRLLLKDPKGAVLFRGNRSYETKDELHTAARKVLAQLRSPQSYKQLEKSLNGFNSVAMQRLFSEKPTAENIVVTKYNYHQRLLDHENKPVVESKNMKMPSAKMALDKRDDFIKNINNQTLITKPEKEKGYRLIPLDKKDSYLDTAALNFDIKTLKSWKWHVQNGTSKEIMSSERVFAEKDEAWDNMVGEAALSDYLTQHDVALRWRLDVNDNISFNALDCYPDAYKAVAAWRQAKTLGSNSKNFDLIKAEDSFKIQLTNEKGKRIAISDDIKGDLDTSKTVIDSCARVFGNRNTKPNYDKEANKYGFVLPAKGNVPAVVSYCAYDSPRDSLQEMEKIYTLGRDKKNYLQSGDQGNPEYNFILYDEQDSFLALPTDHFETAADRNKALNAMVRSVKANKLPVFVKEEPRRYAWSLYENKEVCLQSGREFTTKARAQANLNAALTKEGLKANNRQFAQHIYKFEKVATPARYNFVYGNNNSQNELEPIFISNTSFKNDVEAAKAYTEFVQKLPTLTLKTQPKKESSYEFALFSSDKTTPIVVQYREGVVKGSLENAKATVAYIQTIYTRDGNPKENFVVTEMAENQDGRYEWRFYKKNAPIARSPYCCPGKGSVTRIKSLICDVIPPINLKQCPPKEIVICPKKDPKKYHYRVCFTDEKDHEFVLISYIGFDSYLEAEEAWKTNWLEIINLATNPLEYGPEGKISLNEVYRDPESKACNDTTFIAVIPEKSRRRLEAAGVNLVIYHVGLAELFPIYKVNNEKDEKCDAKYKYRVVVSKEVIPGTDCTPAFPNKYVGRWLWDSVACYNDIEEAIKQYQHFYNLAGTPNNCRILCENGCFYVGLVEVLVESSCEFESPEDAWDDAFPEKKDLCNDCIPGGVREFVYAAEDCKNYIPYCDQKYWKFKVVAPSYFVVDHNCYYNSEIERDEQMKKWISVLEKLDWRKYITAQSFQKKSLTSGGIGFLATTNYVRARKDKFGELCDFINTIRDCLKVCSKNDQDPDAYIKGVIACLEEKLKDQDGITELLKDSKFNIDHLAHVANYFPIYKTEKGYCYRLYWPENDKVISETGLQACGCEEEVVVETAACKEAYPFISSNCYDCCSEALKAFLEFCKLITNGTYSLECTSQTEYGPFSFQIIDKSKELAYHPQQYDSFQEVLDAIEITKTCALDTGMHLLEHILLRPKKEECPDEGRDDTNNNRQIVCCVLPICPDYCCPIEWQPDMEKDDPCAESNPDKIYYLPGSDPYSFWATLVLPAWSRRYRTQEARQAYETFLYKEVPALVGLNILWLSPRRMCDFEDKYRKWLEWKQDPCATQCDPDGVPPNCLLADCIKDLESEDACPSVPGAQGECDCKVGEDPVYDPCCLPPDTTGSIFWGYCPPEPRDETPNDNTALFSTNLNIESATASGVAEPKAKAKTVAKSLARKKAVSKSKGANKENEKTPAKTPTKNKQEKNLLALVRQRKPKYLANIKTIADENMQKTKSYERTQFFLENVPNIVGYAQLVGFFNRYSLQKDNNVKDFLNLLKNATWHLFDKLVLDQKEELKKEDLSNLKSALQILGKKGLSLAQVNKEWKSADLGPMANAKPLSQLRGLLK